MTPAPALDGHRTEPVRVVLTHRERQDRTARALAAAAKSHDQLRCEALRDYVVEINMGVARSVAGRYLNRGLEDEDLTQVAYAALTRAVRDFDPGRGKDFLTYAVPTIRGGIKKHFRDHGWAVRPPRRVQETQARISRTEGDLMQTLGRTPRSREIAAHLRMGLDGVIEARAATGCFAPSSLNRPATGGDDGWLGTIGDLLGTEDRSQLAAEARVTLAPALARLTPRDRRILYLRFFEARTQQEIGEDIGVTQMQVSRLLSRIIRDLRTELFQDTGAHSPRRLTIRQGDLPTSAWAVPNAGSWITGTSKAHAASDPAR